MDHLQPEDIYQNYCMKPRYVNQALIDEINWQKIKDSHYADSLINTLSYMRDVEDATSIYYDELKMSPSAHHPIVGKFLPQWDEEEARHSQLLDRFLQCVQPERDKNWRDKLYQSISWRYRLESWFTKHINRIFGKHFLALHMTWGAINEYSTLLGYLRLYELCEDENLKKILQSICKEEAIHGEFYIQMADFFLAQSKVSQSISKFIINRMWSPVGEGIKPLEETNQVVRYIFSSPDMIQRYDKIVTQKIQKLAGFANFTKPTLTIAQMAQS